MAAIELDHEQWQRLKPLLTTALRLAEEERGRFLAEHLGSEPSLQSCAVEMLRLHDRAPVSRLTSSGDAVTHTAVPTRTQPDFDAGIAIGHYRVIRKLGEGGMGRVYLAEDQRLGRRVALKRLDRSAGQTAAASRAHAIAESRSIAVLNHPGIVTLYDVFEHSGELILAMEYVEGRRLSEHIGAGSIATGFALRLMEQVADAVAYAHARGVLHLDLKPSNIHGLPNGTAKILDFGLARIVTAPDADDESGATRLVGTPGYLSPEQLCFKSPTPASDVYALGVIFFELLTGRSPFSRDDPWQLLSDTIGTPAPLPSSIVPGLPPAIDDIVSRCLAKNSRERLQAHELARAVRNVAGGDFKSVVEPDWFDGLDRRTRARQRRRWASISVGAVLVIAIGSWAATRQERSWIPRFPWTAPSSEVSQPLSLAILPTVGAWARAEDTAMGKAIPALLRPALSRIGSLNVVLLDEETVADTPVQAALRKLGATMAVRCVLTSRERADLIEVEVLSGDGATRAYRTSVPFDSRNPASTFEGVFAAVERGLAPRLPQNRQPIAKAPSTLVPSTLALSHFSEGLEMLERPDVPGNVERAITLLESATQKDPPSALAHAALARARWMHYVDTRSEDSARKAQASVMTALSLDNSLVSVKLSAATIQRGVGNLDGAQRLLEDVIASAPASDEAHRLFGELLAARGQLDRAHDEFETAIALRPLYWRNYRAKGLAYYNAGDFERAAAAFTRVTELQPDSAFGYQMLGAALQQRGSYQGAVAAYETAVKLGPNPAAWSNIGKLHYDNGQYDKAVAAYKEALKIRSASAVTWRNLGDVLTAMRRTAEARSAYEQAEEDATRTTRVDPSDASALSTLAVIHAKLGRQKEAVAEAEKANALSPRDRTVHYRRAVVLMLTGNRPAAQAAIDEAIRLGFSVTEAKLDRDLHGLQFSNQ